MNNQGNPRTHKKILFSVIIAALVIIIGSIIATAIRENIRMTELQNFSSGQQDRAPENTPKSDNKEEKEEVNIDGKSDETLDKACGEIKRLVDQNGEQQTLDMLKRMNDSIEKMSGSSAISVDVYEKCKSAGKL